MPLSPGTTDKSYLKVYHGYGHTHSLRISGHLFRKAQSARSATENALGENLLYLFRRYTARTIGGARVELVWRNQVFSVDTAKDGFFQFDWKSETEVEAGWHEVEVRLQNANPTFMHSSRGRIYVPHRTQFLFLSDIDDTIQVSHSTNLRKKLAVLLSTTPISRKIFYEVGKLYQEFAKAQSSAVAPNPFFYISNSEWNLYDDIVETFRLNGLPEGAFLLNHLKRWFGLLDVGTAPGNTKIRRAARVLNTFPDQKCVLLGDDSQKDPEIYAALVDAFPGRIYAVYLRQVSSGRREKTNRYLQRISGSGAHTCLFSTTDQALRHAGSIHLI